MRMPRLADLQGQCAPVRFDAPLLGGARAVIMAMRAVTMAMSTGVVAMSAVVVAGAQQPRARDIDGQPQAGDGNGLGEMNGHGREQARNRLITDQHRNHCEHDRAGKAGKIAQLPGPKRETAVVRMPARETVGEGGQQQGARVRAHMQAVGNQGNRSEQQAAGDFGRHHRAAYRDDRPSLAFAAHVIRAQEDVAVPVGARRAAVGVHCNPPGRPVPAARPASN